MMDDPIVKEIRMARESIARKNGFNHRKILEDLIHSQRMRKC